MFRKSVALIMIVVCTLVCLPVSSFAAESDLQEDFDNGLMTLTTGLTYSKNGVPTILRYFNSSENGASTYAEYVYKFSQYSNVNPNHIFGHYFDVSYTDGRVLIPEGYTFSFSIHNFYSTFYWGEYDSDNFEQYRYCWLDFAKYINFNMYFYKFDGSRSLVSKDLYEIEVNQNDAMITVKMNSDLYDIDVYRLRLLVNFDVNALWAAYYGNGGWCTDDWFNSYDSWHCTFGYENLFFEISSDDHVTTGLLTSIIENIKNLPGNIRTALSSLFDSLTSSISGFFTNLENKLSSLFSVFTEEQTTYAPIDEGELPSDYQAAEDEAFDAAGVGDLDSNIDSAFKDANSVFSNNNAYAFISGSMEQIVFGNIKISGLVIFSLAMGLCVLVLGRRLNSA